MYGILNWNRPLPGWISSFKTEELMICSNINQVDGAVNVTAVSGISASRNLMLRKAKELGIRWFFILEDDLDILNLEGFKKYIELMDKFKIGVAYYPYDKVNIVLNTIQNPCLIIRLNEKNEEVYIARNVGSILTAYDLTINNLEYDEDLMMTEAEEYVHRCSKNNIIPYFGLHFDIPKSWEYFRRNPGYKTERIKSQEILSMDKNMVARKGLVIEFQSDATDLLIYLFEIEKKLGNYPESAKHI